ncbi:MAG: hypothetical protein ACRDPO_15540 [Streptosporangiaceae bacterium]
MRVVVALGGNALLERGERPDSDIQESHVASAAAALQPLLHDHDLVITHGNDPRAGLLALESAGDPALSRPDPFDVLGAQTRGMIGYWLVQALQDVAGRLPAHPHPGAGAPSPEPAGIVELDLIRLLIGQGTIVVCAAGGGIPVVPDGPGRLRGVEAVVDKDLTAALLAESAGAVSRKPPAGPRPSAGPTTPPRCSTAPPARS